VIRDALIEQGYVSVELDLFPALTDSQLVARLTKPRGKLSLSNFLKRAGLDALRLGLLREKRSSAELNSALDNPTELAGLLKHYPLDLIKTRPLAEAISSAGGVKFDAIDAFGQLVSRPGCYCIGEMLDWEAPTGGYLLTAVLSQAYCVAQGLITITPPQAD
jgi:predicted flavoprotein YhiN